MGKTIAVAPSLIVVVIGPRGRDPLQGLVEILYTSRLELDGGDHSGGTRDKNVDQSFTAADRLEPDCQFVGQVEHVSMTFRCKCEFAVDCVHERSIAAYP